MCETHEGRCNSRFNTKKKHLKYDKSEDFTTAKK